MSDTTPLPDDVVPNEPASRLDRALTRGSKILRLCGNGADNGWSIRVANALFTDCACCIAWRGIAIGSLIGFASGVAVMLAAPWAMSIVTSYL